MAVSISREMLTLFTNDVVVAVDQVTIFVVLDVRWSLFVFFLRQQQLQTPTEHEHQLELKDNPFRTLFQAAIVSRSRLHRRASHGEITNKLGSETKSMQKI